MKRTISLLALIAFTLAAAAQAIKVETNEATGAIKSIKIDGDTTQMNWLVSTDGTQYAWIGEKYGWGLGKMAVHRNHNTTLHAIDKLPYKADGVEITVSRSMKNGDLIETYELRNTGRDPMAISDAVVYIPFNDNYPDSRTCITSRCNAHVWAGGQGAWVNAMRMGGFGPHIGLMLTEGEVCGYEIMERGISKANSQQRGVIALQLPEAWLSPGESRILQWRLFSHHGNHDFKSKVEERGGWIVEADSYVLNAGDTAHIIAGDSCIDVPCDAVGERRVPITMPNGKTTHVELLTIPSEDALLEKRIEFILDHQQMLRRDDPRYGAYMIYDNEGDSIYLNDRPNCNPPDRDEGGERLGMGVLLAKQYQRTRDERLLNSLMLYYRFVREGLQTPDYVTYSSVDKTGRNRGYNYMWVADFYFQMYLATGDKQFATDGYETLQALYRQFGHGFYAVDIPVTASLEALSKAGMKRERKQLIKDFKLAGDVMVKNSVNYPPFEVNYEQSIVAPAVQFLCELYLATGEQKYLDEAKRQLPVLEAFNGQQPSFHLNDIGLRHWDGYWFGKREVFGDTFPHYWSAITAAAFYYYYKITGDEEYLRRARNIARANLCLFTEDGRASCAYIYPNQVDGTTGSFYDPYANDQDWALVFLMLVNS